MKGVTLTHIGGPTLLIEFGGWRILTDPTFDPPGGHYKFGLGTSSDKVAGPSVSADGIGRIDVALVSHDHHEDNLDKAGRALLDQATIVVTTASGAGRLGGSTRGLRDWEVTTLSEPGKPTIHVTATPCRHGPPLSHPIVGDVIGFALRWEGQEQGVLWISGDTVLYDGVKSVADKLTIDTAIIHLGGVQFPISGPLRYTMTARDAGQLIGLIKPRTAIPIHYEGWTHFRQGRDAAERDFAKASEDVQSRLRWIPIGEPVVLGD